jgi:hypothetical protein
VKRYGEFSYTQARLQARHGERPTEAEWKQLLAIASLSQFLQTARKGPLRRWLLELGMHSGIHDMELTLHRHFRSHIVEVARWMPSEWRPAVTWCRHLPELPAIAHLLRGMPAPHWSSDDSDLKPISGGTLQERQTELERSDKAPLAEAADEEHPEALPAAWYRHWRGLWPAPPPSTAAHLHELARTVARARTSLGSADTDRSGPTLERLEQRLTRQFRRHSHEPTAAFAHLALTALLLERLRGALAVRILFPPPAGAGEAA